MNVSRTLGFPISSNENHGRFLAVAGLVLALALFTAAAPASAANPALDQYVEKEPDVEGDKNPPAGKADPEKALGAETYEEFQDYGADGAAAAAAAVNGSGGSGDGSAGGGDASGSTPSATGVPEGSDSGSGSVAAASTGFLGSGSSVVLFVVFALALVAMGVVAVRRGRRAG